MRKALLVNNYFFYGTSPSNVHSKQFENIVMNGRRDSIYNWQALWLLAQNLVQELNSMTLAN